MPAVKDDAPQIRQAPAISGQLTPSGPLHSWRSRLAKWNWGMKLNDENDQD
jgi:hypothetical protein